jgi:hypothetical protein
MKVKKKQLQSLETLNTEDGAPLSDEQKQIFLAAQTFVTNANFPVSLDYSIDSRGPKLNTAEKNIIDGLNRLESGKSSEVSIGSKTFIRKKGNNYEVYTVGTQLGNEKVISTTADIKNIVDLVSGIDREAVRKKLP